jgi:hypothetical protein
VPLSHSTLSQLGVRAGQTRPQNRYHLAEVPPLGIGVLPRIDLARFRRDKTLGSVYTIGKLGSMMHQGNLKSNHPAVQALVVEIHERRGESSLSHPVKKKGAVIVKRAGLIHYGYIFRAKKYVRKALAELTAAASGRDGKLEGRD